MMRLSVQIFCLCFIFVPILCVNTVEVHSFTPGVRQGFQIIQKTYIYCPDSHSYHSLLPMLLKDMSVEVSQITTVSRPLYVYYGFEEDMLPNLSHIIDNTNQFGELLHFADNAEKQSLVSWWSWLWFGYKPDSQLRLTKVLVPVDSAVNFTLPGLPRTCFLLHYPNAIGASFHGDDYRFIVYARNVWNVQRCTLAMTGLLILLAANYLSHCLIFYYFMGVIIALFGSLIIVIVLVFRTLPLRSSHGGLAQLLLLLLGGTISVFYILVEYIRSYAAHWMQINSELAIFYVLGISLISSIFLYWFHIPDSLLKKYPRTQKIVQTLLNLTGGFMVALAVNLPVSSQTIERQLSTLISSVDVLRESIIIKNLMHLCLIYSNATIRCLLTMAIVFSFYLLRHLVRLLHRKDKTPILNTYLPAPLVSKPKRYSEVFQPGSPWASSSPLQYSDDYTNDSGHSPVKHEEAVLSQLRKGKMTEQQVNGHSLRFSHLWSSSPPDRPNRISLMSRPSRSKFQIPVNTQIDSLLTDDESD